jgi:hypothetical protein
LVPQTPYLQSFARIGTAVEILGVQRASYMASKGEEEKLESGEHQP